MMTKKNVMKAAHKIAKLIVKEVGNYSIALSLSLKYVWNSAKRYGKKRFGDVAIYYAEAKLTTPIEIQKNDYYGVPAWIIEKNLSQNEAYAVRNECDAANVERETEKAVLISFTTTYGNVETWCPKSVYTA